MLHNYTLLFFIFITTGGWLQAQNCPASVSGQLSTIRTTIIATDTTPTPIYTVIPTGLPNTEFLILRQDTLAADGFGPPILISSLDGRVVPADLGLNTCQELCVLPFSYDLMQIQLVVDSLLNGLYIGSTTCCTAAGNFFPGLCDSLHAEGIFSGADIQDLNDVINFTSAVSGANGAATSVPNLISTISQLNSFIGLFGNCSAGVAEICYSVSPALSATDCYQVVLPNAATLILASPDTLAAMTSSSYQVTSSYLPNSSTENLVWSIGIPDLGCSINSMGMLQTATTGGTVWVYSTGTRGCQADSILVQITAPINVRSLATKNLDFQVAPMPFDQQLLIEVEAKAGTYQLQLVDVLGQVVYTANQELTTGTQPWLVSTAHLPIGTYILSIQGEKEQKSLSVVKSKH
ncbi:MAG: T9SS type A sorting domain-containing protein [Aureispira sp.]